MSDQKNMVPESLKLLKRTFHTNWRECFKYRKGIEKGKRKDFFPEIQPTLQDLSKSIMEIMRLTIIELVLLLKLARKEQANLYRQRSIFIQAIKKSTLIY